MTMTTMTTMITTTMTMTAMMTATMTTTTMTTTITRTPPAPTAGNLPQIVANPKIIDLTCRLMAGPMGFANPLPQYGAGFAG